LGDILSHLYLLSSTLKHYYDQGQNVDDLPLVRWASLTCLYQIQQKFDEILKNFPNRWIASILRVLIFPYGQRFSKPSDKLNHKVAQLLMSATPSRYRLAEGAFLTDTKDNMMSILEDAMLKTIAAEPIEKTLKTAQHDKVISGSSMDELAKVAFSQQLISKEQLDIVLQAEAARREVVAVDDFASEDLARTHLKSSTQETYASAHTTD
jgi:acyl-CoA dehydrogenase